ncbi:MAG: beta-galactosidase, partial [Anaerolineae bacterium]|nr:beta-galactosidase [Anaerolineae bacterium]
MVQLSTAKHQVLIDDEPAFLQAAVFSYYRLPHRDLWKPGLDQLRLSGYNTVWVPFPWSYHSPAEGFYDFSGPRNLDYLLQAITDSGLWLISHIGPWVDPTLLSGGFPAWLRGVPQVTFDAPEKVSNPAQIYLHQLASWWERLFELFAQRTNHLLTVIHPGPRLTQESSIPLMDVFRHTAQSAGMTTAWSWPCELDWSERLDTKGLVNTWKIFNPHETGISVPDKNTEYTTEVMPRDVILTSPGSMNMQKHRMDLSSQLWEFFPEMLAEGHRVLVFNPGHTGCQWGYWHTQNVEPQPGKQASCGA